MRTTHALVGILLLITQPCAVLAATRVEIEINEPHANRSVSWPMTTGVPFPRGQLTDELNCRLVDNTGQERMLQSRVAATWDAQRSSIRWLTIDFIAEPTRTYTLEFGPEISRKRFASTLRVEREPIGDTTNNSQVAVSTGALITNFSSTSPSALGKIGIVTNEQTSWVAQGRAEGEHFYIDQDGREFSGARDGSDRKVVVEADGPVRASVRVDSFYTGPSGQRIVNCRTRYHFFAGTRLVKAVHEFRVVGSTRQTRFKDIAFSLDLLSDTEDRTVVADVDGAPGNQVKAVEWQDDTQSVSSIQRTYRHFGNPECRGALVEQRDRTEHTHASPEHVGEWMQVRNRHVAITGSLRWMWQQFPKEWQTTQDALTLHLWSPRADELDFGADGIRAFFGEAGRKYLLEWNTGGRLNAISNYFYYAGHAALKRGDVDGQGINKHHEFWLHFGSAEDSAAGQEYGMLAANQPLALASGAWNCSTDVFGPLMSRPTKSKFNAKYERIVDRLFDLGQKAQDDFGDYGWWGFGSGPHYSYQWDEATQRHFADPRRFEYHTYQKETQLWWNYLRSGERKFYDWAIPSEDHWVDIAVTHVPLTYQCEWRGGFRQPQTLHFRPGDWAIDSPLFYIRQRDSAEAWLRGCSQFQASYHRTLETTSLAYYITGDERYNDVLKFWKDYWSDFAGLRSDAPDKFPTWLREQPWFEPTTANDPSKSWAEMIRDYCPFTSGLRHQMTYFFSLSTLYEHTWDPKLGQVLRECANAYIDPKHDMGVWPTQENRLPAFAEAPELAHFWVPALWKYARATQDDRMPGVFKKYFDACYAADPFREDVGRYSNVHLAYAYYFTRDAKHLRPALLELERLLPNAEPLAKPQDLGRRLYNPYAPIQCFTAVPRLLWAIDAARRDGVSVPGAPLLRPQRTAISVEKKPGRVLRLKLWGYDSTLRVLDPTGAPVKDVRVHTTRHASRIQPFDRAMPNFEVYLHELTIPAKAPGGAYVLVPRLELAVLEASHGDADAETKPRVLANAANPIALDDNTAIVRVPKDEDVVQFESAVASTLRITDSSGNTLKTKLNDSVIEVDTATLVAPRVLHVSAGPSRNRSRQWFRIINLPVEDCWCSLNDIDINDMPSREASVAAVKRQVPSTSQVYTSGRFGSALRMEPGRKLQIPDHVTVEGRTQKLFDLREGTIEFFVKRRWDDRLQTTQPVTFLNNGLLRAWSPKPLPLNEWAHVAVEWRPLKRDPSRIAVHIYVNGRDKHNYRSTWWEGYSQKPLTMPNREWLKEFVCETRPGASFEIDELRISTVARYADQSVQLGGQQVFNPVRFKSPQRPFTKDKSTAVLFHFDKSISGESSLVSRPLQAALSN